MADDVVSSLGPITALAINLEYWTRLLLPTFIVYLLLVTIRQVTKADAKVAALEAIREHFAQTPNAPSAGEILDARK